MLPAPLLYANDMPEANFLRKCLLAKRFKPIRQTRPGSDASQQRDFPVRIWDFIGLNRSPQKQGPIHR